MGGENHRPPCAASWLLAWGGGASAGHRTPDHVPHADSPLPLTPYSSVQGEQSPDDLMALARKG
eukprot:scaffold62393_cov31-Tisochrysis_lutea.AAC.5